MSPSERQRGLVAFFTGQAKVLEFRRGRSRPVETARTRLGKDAAIYLITLHCCGENYHADEQHAGRKIRCRKCGRVLTIEAVVPVQGIASSRQPRWLRSDFWTMRPVAIRKVALGGIALAGIVAWAFISARTVNTSGSQAKSSEHASRGTPAVESRSELPDPSGHPAVSLPNGTWILKPRGIRGHGVLRIQNGSDLDSAVKLVTASLPRKVFWVVYVRGHEERTLRGIAAGAYLLRFALGRDWDADTQRFLRDRRFYEAGKQLVFTEREATEDQRGEYTELHLTLNEINGGNLPRAEITEGVFNEGASEN
jgi:hypothetical protein